MYKFTASGGILVNNLRVWKRKEKKQNIDLDLNLANGSVESGLGLGRVISDQCLLGLFRVGSVTGLVNCGSDQVNFGQDYALNSHSGQSDRLIGSYSGR